MNLSAISGLPGQDNPPDKLFPEGGVRKEFQLASPSMGREIPVAVLLPPGGKETPLPVLYAFHGHKAPHLSFSDMKPLREFVAAHPMLVVSFLADEDSGYIDADHRPGSKFTTFFFEELMPEIAKRYRIEGNPALTGFSMGGYGAFHYLLQRPGAFSSVSALSGAFELFDENSLSEYKQVWRPWLESLLGPVASNASAYEAVSLAPRLDRFVSGGGKLPPLLMLCGTGDFLKSSNRRFADRLHSLNAAEPSPAHPLRFEYRESPGGHDWPYWRDHIVQAAAFHWENFNRPAESGGQ